MTGEQERLASIEARLDALERGGQATGEVDRWLPVREAARLIGVHDKTLKRWAAQGRMEGVMRRTPGGLWVVRESWVKATGKLVRL